MKTDTSNNFVQAGFTLIELVMVVVLIGILSAGAMSLLGTRESFSAFVFKNQLLSSARLAQQIALAAPVGATPSTLILSQSGGNFTFTVTKAGHVDPASVYKEQIAGTNISVDGAVLGSHTFGWDRAANIADGLNHKIVIAGQSTFTVCLSAAGFAYESSGVCP